MDIDERIERRLRNTRESGIVHDLESLSPVSHLETPVGRRARIEQLLDLLDPAFVGSLSPSIYVSGPKGSGKSAVVSALFARLVERSSRTHGAIQTSTRAVEPDLPLFAYVDVRGASTRFQLYQDTLAAVSDGPIPEHGVGTDELADRFAAQLGGRCGAIVAVDHTDEPDTPTAATVAEWLTDVDEHVVPICLGRQPASEIDWTPDRTVEFEAYRRHVLVELLTSRLSSGVVRDAFSHDQVRQIAEWGSGDAHDALAAAMGAAVTAERAEVRTVRAGDLDAGIAAVPRPSASLGRVLALPASRQRILYELVRLDPEDRASVGAATTAIARTDAVELSESTLRRVLYELADVGLLDRVRAERESGKGRPPSRLVPQFPTLAFTELYERFG